MKPRRWVRGQWQVPVESRDLFTKDDWIELHDDVTALRLKWQARVDRRLRERAPPPACPCKLSDTWRCAVQRKLRTVSCPCACHRADQ